MLTSVHKLNLRYRIVIYTIVMLLLVGLFLAVLYLMGSLPDNLLSKEDPVLLPWLVCFGAGLASLVIVEPFRRPSGSPYGFLLGGAVRTFPPLVLVILFVVTRQPVDRFFWINLLIAYFVMLWTVIPLTLPAQSNQKSIKPASSLEEDG